MVTIQQSRKCNECNHYNKQGSDTCARCEHWQHDVYGQSVACKYFDDTVVF